MENRERNYSTCQNLTDSIKAELTSLRKISRRRCIYRVPKSLREVNNKAYTPMVVSIGPLHYKDERLLEMEVHKLEYLQSFLHDSQINADLNTYLQVVKDNEAQIRESYANPTIYISSDEFARMVFIDSVFIIELFRRIFDPSLIKDDHIWGNPGMIYEVRRDIRLAENQLPFFILKDLYWTAFKPHENIDTPYFTDLACFFSKVKKRTIHIDAASNEATCCHLVDLLQSCCLPREQTIPRGIAVYDQNILCPTATALRESGVMFRVAESDTSSWNRVHFDNKKGILTIPKLRVDDRTESLLRNLIAFEQCHYQSSQTYISDYEFFMDCLINTPEDVQVLARAGIIDNWLGSNKDVSDLFNSLGNHVKVSSNKYYYAGITEQLTGHCNKRWNHYRATLKHNYFKHPWAVVSVIYTAILLLLTLLQLVVGIIAVPNVVKVLSGR